jgi:hypothetical protein
MFESIVPCPAAFSGLWIPSAPHAVLLLNEHDLARHASLSEQLVRLSCRQEEVAAR